MKVSLIVPAFNEEKLLPGSLRSMKAALTAFQERGWETELVVCNNNSTDRTAEIAAAEGAQVVFEPINQMSRARNAGAAAASGDWFIFVDADTWPSAELFAEIADEMAGGRCLAGGSTIRTDSRHAVAWLVSRVWNLLSRTRHLAGGMFMFVEAEAFRKAGGFNLALYTSEDVDLYMKLRRMARATGRRISILHRHPIRTSARKLYLYSLWDWIKFLLKTIVTRGETLKDPKECFTWYDGRR